MKRKPATSNKIKRAPFQRRSYIPEAPIARIAAKLSIGESTAALDILVISRRNAGLPCIGDLEIDIQLPVEPDAADDRASRQSDMTRAYSKWRTDLRDTEALRVADAVLFNEQALTAIEETNHWRRGTALGHLTTALRHFAFLRGNSPRGEARNWNFTTQRKEATV